MPFGKINYTETINNLVDTYQQRIDKSITYLMNEKPTVVTYYNIDTDSTTVSEGTENTFQPVGDYSGIYYNRIRDCVLYGIDKINISLDMSEFGPSGSHQGECKVLPNTFEPHPGDYFKIRGIKGNPLFKITKATPDTLDNGMNYYICSYELAYGDSVANGKDIEKQVLHNYVFDMNRINSGVSVLVPEVAYDYNNKLNAGLEQLKTFYYELFFASRIQTFVYQFDNIYIYDPYLIEFMIRNEIKPSTEYISIIHACATNKTFAIEYSRSNFYYIETCQKDKLHADGCLATLIQDPTSLMYVRTEQYYQVNMNIVPWKNPNLANKPLKVAIFEPSMLSRILDNKPYDIEDSRDEMIYQTSAGYKPLMNIIIKYFNDEQPTAEDLQIALERTELMPTKANYYLIPIVLYIYQKIMDEALSPASNS